MRPRTLQLTSREAHAVAALARGLARRHATSDEPGVLGDATVAAACLPTRVREFMTGIRDDDAGAFVLAGHRLDDALLGPTPTRWKRPDASHRSLPYELLALVYGCALGEVFGWVTQQDGHLVHDIIPVEGYEGAQVGASSTSELLWHTEDAFHPARADWVGFACLRNPDRVPTTVAHVADALRSVRDPRPLFQPCVTIRPDDAHYPGFSDRAAQLDARRRDSAEAEPPAAVAVLSGSPELPRLCIDPAYMEPVANDAGMRRALDELEHALEQGVHRLVLEPGDFAFLDNHRVVHGRAPFRARYDGRDRWLKRINVSRDLAKAHTFRARPGSRLLVSV